MSLKFLDQTGRSLVLSLCQSWVPCASGRQFEVPTRWCSQGHLNLIGTLAIGGQGEYPEVSELTAFCGQAYLDTLAAQSEAEQPRLGKARLTVVGLDNASLQRGQAVRAREPVWAAKGLLLRYLPPFCPVLNRIETTWRVLQDFLLPRRCYNTVAELRTALLIALKTLGATFI